LTHDAKKGHNPSETGGFDVKTINSELGKINEMPRTICLSVWPRMHE